MSEQPTRKLPFWPFIVADALLLGLAVALYKMAQHPLLAWEAWAMVVCVFGAGVGIVLPFLLRNAADRAVAQADSFNTSLVQISKIDQAAGQIANATAQWQSVQGYATQIADISKELANSMSREAKGFAESMQKASDSEKAHLRLEIEKMRRAEVEWVQVLTRMLDHVFALVAGARQSGQKNVIEQVGQFQGACLDIARRVGLSPIVPEMGVVFDARVHQCVDEGKKPEEGARIEGTLASGYSYQGQIIRRAVVVMQKAEAQASAEAAPKIEG